MTYLLGCDIGSSSIKASLMEVQSGKVLASAASPKTELPIIAPKPGWAEQNPAVWWENLKLATHELLSKIQADKGLIKAIGISYQMHGLVAVDKSLKILRPAIIWCDSRAVQIGEQAARDIGQTRCLKRLMNLPGNFTASKLKWVKDNQPRIYSRIHKIMLPGDYIAMKMTGSVKTTFSGLSEAILWDFKNNCLADFVLENYGIDPDLIPEPTPSFALHGTLTASAAKELGLNKGTAITYRAGDQPNNAWSLGVLNPGQAAVTAGTSGVVCAITNKMNYDSKSRVNTFLHVNHTPDTPKYCVLLCVNGTGILNSWMRQNFTADDQTRLTYDQMNHLAASIPPGSDGLSILPYGNGAERTLQNKDLGASVHGWQFNIHTKAHFLRASQEGIVFALNFGLGIMADMDISIKTVRAGLANMFLSPVFCEAFAAVTNSKVELYNTDGSQGAARGAGFGAGFYKTPADAFVGLKPLKTIEPDKKLRVSYSRAWTRWKKILLDELQKSHVK